MELAVASATAASEGSPEGDDELSDGGTPTGDLRVHGPLGGAAQNKDTGLPAGQPGTLIALHLQCGTAGEAESHTDTTTGGCLASGVASCHSRTAEAS